MAMRADTCTCTRIFASTATPLAVWCGLSLRMLVPNSMALSLSLVGHVEPDGFSGFMADLQVPAHKTPSDSALQSECHDVARSEPISDDVAPVWSLAVFQLFTTCLLHVYYFSYFLLCF